MDTFDRDIVPLISEDKAREIAEQFVAQSGIEIGPLDHIRHTSAKEYALGMGQPFDYGNWRVSFQNPNFIPESDKSDSFITPGPYPWITIVVNDQTGDQHQFFAL